MHELSVTESLLEITLRHAESAQARQVTDLYLVIGQWATIVDDSVQFYWDIISADTIAAGAKLHFRRILAELVCMDCDHHFHPEADLFNCPLCGSVKVKIITGQEFYLDSIEIEK